MEARRAKPGRPSRTDGKEDLLKRLRETQRRLREIEERYELVMGAVNEGVYDTRNCSAESRP